MSQKLHWQHQTVCRSRSEFRTTMCDVLVALPPATGGATLFAKNSDRPPHERQILEWIEARSEKSTRATYVDIKGHETLTQRCIISRPEWGWGAEHGVNESGVAIGNATIYTTLDPRGFPDALTGMDIVRLGLERATSARQAMEIIIELITTYGQGGSGHAPSASPRPYWNSFLVADGSSGWVIETSGRDYAVQEIVDTWAISNRTTIPEFDGRRHPRQPVERLVDPRLNASRDVLERRPVTTELLKSHLASHGQSNEGWNVCMHVEGIEKTTASIIAELSIQDGPRVWVTQESPCQSQYELLTF